MQNTATVNITDFRIKSPTLAKVIISFTGPVDAEFIRATLSKKLDYLATPITSSFKQVKAGVAVGFVRANKAVRHVTQEAVTAGYRVMSSNILMDNDDKSLWEVKQGVAGKYLARHGQEDLTALVEASVQRRTDVPQLRHITIAKAAASELVAFVDAEGDVDHGFAVATNDAKVKVVSFNRRIAMTVDYDQVISIQPVTIPKRVAAAVTAAMTPEQKKNAVDYWKTLYSYDTTYMNEVVQQVNEGTL